jgi:hypothetical protein
VLLDADFGVIVSEVAGNFTTEKPKGKIHHRDTETQRKTGNEKPADEAHLRGPRRDS